MINTIVVLCRAYLSFWLLFSFTPRPCSAATKYMKRDKALTSFPDDIPNDVTTLDLYDNALTSVTAGDLRTYTSLEKLILGRNSISSIATDAFNNLPVKELNLASNDLTAFPNIGPLHSTLETAIVSNNHIASVNISLIQRMTSLKKLYMENTWMTSFPGPLSTVSPITDMRLDDCRLVQSPWDALSGYDNLHSIKIHKNPDISLDFLYNLTAGMSQSYPKITKVYLSRNWGLENISRHLDMLSPFPSTTWLYMNQLPLLELNPPVGVLSNLSYLYAQGQDTLPVDILDNMTSLTELDLSYSSISGLHRLTSTNIPLRKLTLKESPLLRRFDPDVFENLPNLHTVNMVDNVANQQFPNFAPIGVTLKYVYMSNNNLSVMPRDGLNSLANLTRLELQDNKLNVFPNLTGTEETLETLYLDNNRLEELPPGGFPTMEMLSVVYLQDNMLNSFPNITGLGDCLTTLKLQRNNISTVAFDAFTGVEKLAYLDLSDNKLASLPNVAPSGGTLHTLHLDSNQIIHLGDTDRDILSQLSDIKELKLNDNGIVSFPTVLGQLPKLQRFYLQDNALTSFPNISCCVTSLKTLDVSSNQISDVSYLVSLGHSAAKPDIILKDNQVKIIPDLSSVISVLTSLQLQTNPIVCNCTTWWMRTVSKVKMSSKPCDQPPELQTTKWSAITESDLCLPEGQCFNIIGLSRSTELFPKNTSYDSSE